jgi:hypothetical protein
MKNTYYLGKKRVKETSKETDKQFKVMISAGKYFVMLIVVYNSVMHWSRCIINKSRLLILSKHATLFIK